MIQRFTAIILTVLISINAFAAYGTVPSNCSDQSCCCAGMAMTAKMEAGQADKYLKMGSGMGCCCGDDPGSTCSLTMMGPLEKMEWALSSNRIDPSLSTPSIIASTKEIDKYLPLTSRSDIMSDTLRAGSPPIYLSSMSFLC